MSIPALNWALRNPHVQDNVKSVPRSVLIVLADHANKRQHQVWISRMTLVDETGFSDGACGNALKVLQAGGFIRNVGSRDRNRVWELAVATAGDAEATTAGAAELVQQEPLNYFSTTSAPQQRELLTNPNPNQTTTTTTRQRQDADDND